MADETSTNPFDDANFPPVIDGDLDDVSEKTDGLVDGQPISVNEISGLTVNKFDDVELTALKNADMLRYDGLEKKWKNVVANLIPKGLIAMFRTSCPSGWTRVVELDDRFPRGATAFGEQGGSASHTHTTGAATGGASSNHTHNVNITTGNGDPAITTGPTYHSHPVSGDTAGVSVDHTHQYDGGAADVTPLYCSVVFCSKD